MGQHGLRQRMFGALFDGSGDRQQLSFAVAVQRLDGHDGGLPWVIVPVLSTASTRIWASSSR